MNLNEARNRQFLSDLFSGPFRGHAIIMVPPRIPPGEIGDFAISSRSVKDWIPWAVKNYESQVKWLEEIDDDSVPYVNLCTNTGIFAAAFGCPIHVFSDSPACATSIVTTAEQADRILIPDINRPSLLRVLELAELIRKRLGPEVPISVPDIQSAFDIAALIWKKGDFLVAMYESPESVKKLVNKCQALLKNFLTEFKRRIPECNLCHCPIAWAPPNLGCWVTEDEAGTMSAQMFEEFCLPNLIDLSKTFGGLFMHCCASADHQYSNFRKIPNFRGIERHFQTPGPRPAIEAFSGQTVLMHGVSHIEQIDNMLNMALPNTRFLFDFSGLSIDEAKRTYEHLRKRCPRIVNRLLV